MGGRELWALCSWSVACVADTQAPASLTPTSSFTSSRGVCFLPPFKAHELSPLEHSLSFLGICPGGDTCISVSISPQTPVFPRGRPRWFRAGTEATITGREAGRCQGLGS